MDIPEIIEALKELGEERRKMGDALKNAQDVIHQAHCLVPDAGGKVECWKECREAREALS